MDRTAPTFWQDQYIHTANIPSNYVRLIGHELGLTLRDLPKLLQFTDLSSAQLMQDECLLSTKQMIQIFHNSLLLSERPDFGLSLGQRLTPTTHGAMGFLINSSPNLHVALKAVQSFLPTRISFAQLDLQYTQDHIVCSLSFNTDLANDIYRLIAEACMVIFFQCAECIIGQPLREAKIAFNYEKPEYHHNYQDYFLSECLFSQPTLHVELPKTLCEIHNASANQETFLLAKQQCEHMLAHLQPTKQSYSYSYQIQKIILSTQLHNLSEDYLAAALFMSKRTLARYLSNEGTSFRQIREKILSKQASDYLTQTSLSIEAIATLLNYHDSANFRRAFKRWYQMTPSQYKSLSSNKQTQF